VVFAQFTTTYLQYTSTGEFPRNRDPGDYSIHLRKKRTYNLANLKERKLACQQIFALLCVLKDVWEAPVAKILRLTKDKDV